MRYRNTLLLAAIALHGGCGANDPNPAHNAPPAASVGDEPPLPAAAPVARSQGTVRVEARVNGQPAAAHVRFLDAPRPIEAETGEAVSVEPGSQRIEITIRDADMLADRPSQKLQVFVESGKEALAEVTFPWAKVQLNVIVGGRTQPGVPIKLLRNDAVVAELKSAAAMHMITPGKYEADVLLNGRTIRVHGLNIMASAEQAIPVRAQ